MRYNSSLSMLFLAIVCASVSLSSFAQPNEDYSLNVVGFEKITAVSTNFDGYSLFSTPFNQDLTDPEARNIDHVLGPDGVGGEVPEVANNVLLYDPTNMLSHFSTYYLFYTTQPGYEAYNWKWMSVSAGDLATNTFIQPGQGFWYINRSESDLPIVLAGNVVDDAVVTNNIVPGLQLLSYPFSKPICMTDLTLTNGMGGEVPEAADNILLYDPTNVLSHFSTYYLFYTTQPGYEAYNWKWISVSAGDLATKSSSSQGRVSGT